MGAFVGANVERLVALLTRERLLAELVVFKLVEMRQLLQAGEARFLPWAAEEVERATGALRDVELQRALVVVELATERGLADVEPSLDELVEDTSEPWRTVLVEAATSLRALCREAEDLVQANRALAEQGVAAVSDLLGRAAPPLDDGLALYGPDATVRRSGVPTARTATRL